MKRLMDWHLKQWKVDQHRKPLLIRGARQVGKTYGVRQLGKSFENLVEINFERKKATVHKVEVNPSLRSWFTSTYECLCWGLIT